MASTNDLRKNLISQQMFGPILTISAMEVTMPCKLFLFRLSEKVTDYLIFS